MPEGRTERDVPQSAPPRETIPADYRRDGYYQDEISLRDLYLILKRGLPLILGVALVAGVVAFLGASFRPQSFEAEATVLSSPSAVTVQDEGTLAFDPRNAVTFETYRTIATSRAVFEATAERLAGGEDSGSVPAYRELQSAASLEQLTGPSNPTQVVPLTVLHRLSWRDPEQAAAFANAWAETTVDTMRRTLLGNFDPVLSTTSAAVETRLEALETAEEQLEAFRARDDAAELQATIDALTIEVADGRRRLSEIAGSIEVEEARLESLAQQFADTDFEPAVAQALGASDRSAAVRLADAQAGLEAFDRENALEGLRAEIAFLLGNTPQTGSLIAPSSARSLPELRQRLRDMPREIATLEARIAADGPDADSLRSQLAGIRAEQGALEQQIASTEAYLLTLQDRLADLSARRTLLQTLVQLETLRSEQWALESQVEQARADIGDARDQLSRLDRDRNRVTRNVQLSQSAYTSVADLEQLVGFVTELAPGGTRIINSASVPIVPSGPGRTLISLLAIVLAGMLATLFVFLREAVREPTSGVSPESPDG